MKPEMYLARTLSQKAMGFQYSVNPERKSILFVDMPESASFHMNNVNFPLSIASLDESGGVLNVGLMEAGTGTYTTVKGTSHVIEAPPDLFDELSLVEGSTVDLDQFQIQKVWIPALPVFSVSASTYVGRKREAVEILQAVGEVESMMTHKGYTIFVVKRGRLHEITIDNRSQQFEAKCIVPAGDDSICRALDGEGMVSLQVRESLRFPPEFMKEMKTALSFPRVTANKRQEIAHKINMLDRLDRDFVFA